jgi:hypothetical protein
MQKIERLVGEKLFRIGTASPGPSQAQYDAFHCFMVMLVINTND